MNKITLLSIKIEGFNSIIKPLEYRLDSPGLNLILGKNGAGKTQIFSALAWVGYGKTLKKSNRVEPWDSRKTKDYHGTKVELYLDRDGIKYRIIRCSNYTLPVKDKIKGGSNLYLIVNNQFNESTRDKNQMKQTIRELLGASFELFKNSIIFAQKLKRIIQEEGPKKKEIFEEAFETTYIQRGQTIAQKELQTLKTEHQTLTLNIDLFTDRVQTVSGELKQAYGIKKDRKLSIASLNKKISLKTDELETLKIHKKLEDKYEAKVKAIKSKAEELPKLEKELSELKLARERYNNKLLGIVSLIQKPTTKPSGIKFRVCTKCGNEITKVQAEVEYGNLMGAWRKNKRKYDRDIEDKETTIKQVEIIEKQIQGKVSEILKYNDIKENIKLLEGKLKKYQGASYKLNTIKDMIKSYRDDLEELTSKKLPNTLEIKSELAKLESQKERKAEQAKIIASSISDLTWVIKDPLSNSGIKAYIFNELLRKVNKSLIAYSDYLGYLIKFGIDLSSAKKDFYAKVYEGTEEKDYNDLSGGQQQLVDIAIAFSIHEVTSEETNYNMLGLDEVFESLDEDNVEIVIGLIEMMAKTKSVHLITHLTSLRSTKASITRLKLDKNKTTILV